MLYQFYVGKDESRMCHPLLNHDDSFLFFLKSTIRSKEYPDKTRMLCLPVFDYKKKEIAIINSKNILLELYLQIFHLGRGDFTQYDIIVTNLGRNTLEQSFSICIGLNLILAPLDQEWKCPSRKEVRQFAQEYYNRKMKYFKDMKENG